MGTLRLPAGKSLSLWERWHCEAMTERANPSPKSLDAAISRPFVRVILSPRLHFLVSVLALSGASRQLSQRESHWQTGPVCKLSAQRLTFAEKGI